LTGNPLKRNPPKFTPELQLNVLFSRCSRFPAVNGILKRRMPFWG